MTMLRLVQLTVAILLFASPAFAAKNEMIYRDNSKTIYQGSYDDQHNNNTSNYSGETVTSNSGYWEDDTSYNSRTLTRNNNKANNTSSQLYSGNRNANTYANQRNTVANNSNKYLNRSNTAVSNGTYRFQYGGYEVKNNTVYNQPGRTYGYSPYNFYGDPAYYNGAAYQNYRGYDNVVDGYGYNYNSGYNNGYGYNYGYYGR